MVSFVCDACGQTVKKNRVEKHYQFECRNCSVLSCIDCGKDFAGDSYASHTSCLTEAEKYQGKLFKSKDKANKGELKQKNWIMQVQEATNKTKDPKLKGMLERLSAYSNIPRKQTKFENTTNQLDNSDKGQSDDHSQRLEIANGEENCSEEKFNESSSVSVENGKKSKEKRKRKKECKESENDVTPAKRVITETPIDTSITMSPNGKFHWHKTIKRVLQSCTDKEISKTKLRKKVISEFQNHGMDHRASTLEECYALFDKKLNSYPKVNITGKIVKLI